MEYLIAVFKSRTHTMRAAEELQKMRVPVEIINTPRQVSLGCGLSVKFPYNGLTALRRIMALDNYYSFGGVFLIGENGYRPL